MSAISGYINTIQNAVYGEQVRTAIVNALRACYSDVENPDLQSAAFQAAIEAAYQDGILDITEVTLVSQMTNQNIIYRYMGTEAGYKANTLYYYNGTAWAPISAPTDTTLTKPGEPADAYTVGQLLGIGAFDITEPALWERKTIYAGERVASQKIIALINYLPTTVSHISIASGYESLLYRYTNQGVYDGFWAGTGFSKTGNSVWRTDFDIPQDNYKYVITLRSTGGADVNTSAAVNVSCDATQTAGLIQAVGKLQDDVAELSNIGERYGAIIDNWTASKCVGFVDTLGVLLPQGSLWDASTVLVASDYVDVGDCAGMLLEIPIPRVSDSTQPQYGLSFYDKDKNPVVGRGAACAYGRQAGDDYAVVMRFYITDQTKYFRTTYWTPGSTAAASSPFYYNVIFPQPSEAPITVEAPTTVEMQNAIRRARQLTDIKWTPRVNIPRYSMMNGSTAHFLDWFYADTEYTGIPYSGAGGGEGNDWTTAKEWGYAHNWVGGCIPFESFVTAARYPASILGETKDQSAYNYDSAKFGAVCTALVNYAVNGPWPLRSILNFFNTSDGEFLKLSNNTVSSLNVNNFTIGDFLYHSTHVAMITDVLRDNAGNVTHFEVCEATTVGNGNNSILGGQLGGICRRKMFPAAEWKTRYANYTVYRRPSFYGIPYTPSKYVNTGNEGDGVSIVDLPCIPYLGNGAIYKVGYIHNSKILIGATGFTSLVVTKDGEAFGTFDVTGLTEVSVGFSAAGNYSAYLKNGNVQTMACTWKVES